MGRENGPVPFSAERLAAFAIGLRAEDVPPPVRQAAALHLLDALGCALAAHALGLATEGREAMAELGGVEEASVIGLPERLPAPHAALANAMLAHGLDFDDTHPDALCHVSAVVGPAALAVGEACGADGRALLAALVAGSEVTARIGMAAPGAFHAKGFHPTAVCGVFGATVTAARLAGLDLARATSALGIAGSMASGLLAFLADGTPTKPFHPGWAAHAAIMATRLAARGAAGPPSVLEGRYGLFHAFLGQEAVDLEPQLADLGSRWETPRIAYKPYPACHLMHGVLDAAAAATGGTPLAAEAIADVVVTVPEAAVPVVLEPAAAKAAPRTEYEGKFSLPYSVAAMLVHGTVSVATYGGETMQDPALRAVARRVSYATRPYPTFPAAYPGGIRIRLRDGTVLEAEVLHQQGSPGQPLGADRVRDKFRRNAALALDDAGRAALEETVLGLEALTDASAILGPLGKAPERHARGLA